MEMGWMGAITGALKGNREAETGEGMQPLGNGFYMWNPGDPSKKLEGTIGGAVEGFIGSQGSGGLMDSMGEKKEAGKLMQKDAKTFDFLHKNGELGKEAPDPNTLSAQQKSEYMTGVRGATEVGFKLMGEQKKRDVRSTPRGLFDLDSNAIIPGTGPEKESLMTVPAGREIVRNPETGAVGTWDAKNGRYNWKLPPSGTTMRATDDGLEYSTGGADISRLPVYDFNAGNKQSSPASLAPQDQAALEWAQANPNDPRAAAILKKLGVQ